MIMKNQKEPQLLNATVAALNDDSLARDNDKLFSDQKNPVVDNLSTFVMEPLEKPEPIPNRPRPSRGM